MIKLTAPVRTILLFYAVLIAGPATAEDLPRLDAGIFQDAIESAGNMPRLHSLLISQDGDLVLEKYFNGRDAWQTANVKSVSKSIMSALIGIAIEQGHIPGTDQTIADYYGELLPQEKREITIGNLLSMQAGLETTSFYNFGRWVLSDDWVRFALEQPVLAPPGTRMLYSTGNTHLLSDILTQATGQSTLEFARKHLGQPLGFKLASWTQDPNGVYFGGNNMELTPRQMMVFGQLYLNNGKAGGRQVIPAEWIERSLTPLVRSTRDEERQYGLGWWIRDMAGVPTVYAWGYGGQFILLVRDLNMVVVTTSDSNPGNTRRSHIRSLYALLEHEIVAPAVAASNHANAADD